jgi:hypothetical protein
VTLAAAWPALASSVALIVIAISTGCVVVADYSWFGALYMTVITCIVSGDPAAGHRRARGPSRSSRQGSASSCVATVLTALFVSGDLASRRRKEALKTHTSLTT